MREIVQNQYYSKNKVYVPKNILPVLISGFLEQPLKQKTKRNPTDIPSSNLFL